MISLKFFCLPFAGGNAYSYISFEEYLPENIEMIGVELPGRGDRLEEAFLTDIYEAAEDIFYQIKDQIKSPYVIYGHSMGGLLGYILTHKISSEKLPVPKHLFFSGSKGPSYPVTEKSHHLPKEEFWAKIKAFGGIQEEILEYEEMIELFEPVLRSDIRLIEEYEYRQTARLPIPITVFTGEDDRIDDKALSAWQNETKHPIKIHRFSGGHFFVFDHTKVIVNVILKTAFNIKNLS